MADEKKQTGLNFETVASIVAMLVGAVAVFIAWDQAQVMRNQQHASVWPIVTSDFDVTGDEEILALTLKVSNRGVGPAIIETASITAAGEPIPSLTAFLSMLFGDINIPEIEDLGGATLDNSVLGAGESIDVLTIYWRQTDESEAAFGQLAERLYTGEVAGPVVEACYCSVFNRCFESGGSGVPRETKKCPPRKGIFDSFNLNE